MAFDMGALFNKYKGQSLLVPGQSESLRGQCVMAVDILLHDSEFGWGLPYVYTPIAANFWLLYSNLPVLNQNFDRITDGSIKAGDMVVFSGNLPGSEGAGHVDFALYDGSKSSYVGADSNWQGNLTLQQYTHVNGNQYIYGTLRRRNVMPDDYKTNEGDIINYFRDMLGHDPTDADKADWVGVTHKKFIYDKLIPSNLTPKGQADAQIAQIKKIVD